MQFDNLIGESLDKAKEYVKVNNLEAEFTETRDRFNTYGIKRIIRVREQNNKLEILYTGFPSYKE